MTADSQNNGLLPGAASPGANLAPNGTSRPTGFGVDFKSGAMRLAAAYDSNAHKMKTMGLYGSYDAGVAVLMAAFEKGDMLPTSLLATVPISEASRWSVSAKIPVSAGTIKVGYMNWKDEDVKKFGLGFDYPLSKRTTLYTDLGKLSGNGRAGTSAGALSDLNRKTRFDVGINHKF